MKYLLLNIVKYGAVLISTAIVSVSFLVFVNEISQTQIDSISIKTFLIVVGCLTICCTTIGLSYFLLTKISMEIEIEKYLRDSHILSYSSKNKELPDKKTIVDRYKNLLTTILEISGEHLAQKKTSTKTK